MKEHGCVPPPYQETTKDKLPLFQSMKVWLAIEDLKRGDFSIRTRQTLEKAGCRILPKLVLLLQHKDPRTRGKVTYLLGEIGGNSAVPHILESIRRGMETAETFEVLGLIGSREAVDPLHDYLKSGSGNKPGSRLGGIKEDCAKTLGVLKDESSVDPLIDYLRNNWSPQAARSLGKLRDTKAVPILSLKIQTKPEKDYRSRAISTKDQCALALAEIGDESAVGIISNYVAEEKTQEGLEALIVFLKKTNNIKMLETLLQLKINTLSNQCMREVFPYLAYRGSGSRLETSLSGVTDLLKKKLKQLPEKEKNRIVQLICYYQPTQFNLLGELEDPKALEELLKRCPDDVTASAYIPYDPEYLRALSRYPVRPAVERIVRALSAVTYSEPYGGERPDRIVTSDDKLRTTAFDCLSKMGSGIIEHLEYFYNNLPELNEVWNLRDIGEEDRGGWGTGISGRPQVRWKTIGTSLYDNSERFNSMKQGIIRMLEYYALRQAAINSFLND